MINSKKIKERMAERSITQRQLAKELGIATPTMNQKINNVRPMDLKEAEKIAEVLHIPVSDFKEFFLS